ncbi:DUF4158 domain-containing protein [Actinomadura montaniterrae]|uniref:DUF4158 domain-containing protein n=1 Tax=Actinomadura montaniterrae TaxID=1803903 RepID=A0A6L3W2W5_9ACTN|nr:DUF4158 domain-containing protein [Actinomadura montaniterrae]
MPKPQHNRAHDFGNRKQADLERVFFLDDEDRALLDRRRGEHIKLGFSLPKT